MLALLSVLAQSHGTSTMNPETVVTMLVAAYGAAALAYWWRDVVRHERRDK